MKILGTILLLFIAIACGGQEKEITLERVIIEAEEINKELPGKSNISFQSVGNEITYPSDWTDPEVAVLANGKNFEAIHVSRNKKTDEISEYFVDTNSDFDFRGENKLNFIQHGDRSVADVPVYINMKETKESLQVHYQVVKIQDWIYGRISEYRKGKISFGNEDFDIILRPGTRNHPIYRFTPWLDFLIDLNKDNKFSEKWQVTDQGSLVPSEKFDITHPFLLKDKVYQVSKLDSLGESITIKTSQITEAPIQGFNVPDLKTEELEGREQNLHSYLGKPILLEFWSTSCPFSETVRPDINQLYELYSDKFTLISSPREKNIQEIEMHLNEHPKKG